MFPTLSLFHSPPNLSLTESAAKESEVGAEAGPQDL